MTIPCGFRVWGSGSRCGMLWREAWYGHLMGSFKVKGLGCRAPGCFLKLQTKAIRILGSAGTSDQVGGWCLLTACFLCFNPQLLHY